MEYSGQDAGIMSGCSAAEVHTRLVHIVHTSSLHARIEVAVNHAHSHDGVGIGAGNAALSAGAGDGGGKVVGSHLSAEIGNK